MRARDGDRLDGERAEVILPGSQSEALIKPFTVGVFQVERDTPRNTLRKVRFTAKTPHTLQQQHTTSTHNFKQQKQTRKVSRVRNETTCHRSVLLHGLGFNPVQKV